MTGKELPLETFILDYQKYLEKIEKTEAEKKQELQIKADRAAENMRVYFSALAKSQKG